MKVYAHKNSEMNRIIKDCIETENYQYGAIDLQDVCNFILDSCAYNCFDCYDLFDEDDTFLMDCVIFNDMNIEDQIISAIGKECEVHYKWN